MLEAAAVGLLLAALFWVLPRSARSSSSSSSGPSSAALALGRALSTLSSSARSSARSSAPMTPTPPAPSSAGGSSHPWDRGGAPLTERALEEIGAVWNVPARVLAGVARVESNFRPRARGAAGEIGMFQIMPLIARELLRRDGFPDLSLERVLVDPTLGAWLAAELLSELRDQLAPGAGRVSELAAWADPIQAYNVGAPRFLQGMRAVSYLAGVSAWAARPPGELVPEVG